MAPEGGRGRRARRVFAAGCALGLLLTPGFNVFETPAPETVEQLLTRGRLSFDRPPVQPTAPYRLAPDGRYYTIHELGTVILSLPAGVAGLGLARSSGVPFKRAFEFVSAVGAAALFGLVLVALMWDLLRDTSATARRQAGLLLALVLGSQYAVYAGFGADVSVCAALIVFTCVAWRGVEGDGARLRACLAVGALAGLLVLVKVSTALVLLCAAALMLWDGERPWRQRRWRLAALSLGAAPFLAGAAWWNHVHQGAPWRSPFPACHDWELRLLGEGIAGSLVSPVKGLLLFTPALLLLPAALRTLLREPAHRREGLLVAGSFALTFLRLAPTECWHSAAGWGIRYYVPWIPALMLVLARGVWWRPAAGGAARVLRVALVAAGLVVNLSGLVTNFHYRRQLCGEDPWNPRGSAPCALAALPANVARAGGFAVPEVVVPGASPAFVFVSNRLTFWWYALRTVGVPAWASWALGLSLLAAAAGAWRSAFASGPADARVRLPGTPAAISEGDA
jgi:hypothetical protein